MTFRQTCALLGVIALIPVTVALMGQSAVRAQENVSVTEITPELLVFTTAAGNVVASVGPVALYSSGRPQLQARPTSVNSLRVEPNRLFDMWSFRPRTQHILRGMADGDNAGRLLPCMRMRSNV
jgi:hypothetical protein